MTADPPAAMAIATGFVRKLYRILDQESGAIISWDASGASFSIHDGDTLDRLVLPRYFRGRLFAFRQQLREHGFQRLGASASGNAEAYAHTDFRRGCPDRLSAITRTPQPRRRPSRRRTAAAAKPRAAKPATGTAAVVLPSKVAKDCHRVAPYPSSSSDGRARGTALSELAGNPLFASSDGGALAQFLSPMAVDGVKHSLDFASDGSDNPLSDEAMARLMSLLADSRSVDEAARTSSKSGGRNIFEPSDPMPVMLPPVKAPVVTESHQFSADTMDMMLHWLSADGAPDNTMAGE